MIYDVSMPIKEGMQVYKNKLEKQPSLKTVANHQDNGAYETELTFNLHTGTHIDFPLHMIDGGETSNTEMLEKMIGDCKVFDMTHLNDRITKEDLVNLNIDEDDFILFKTTNSLVDHFVFDFIFLSEDGASYLADKKIRGVGIDGLGIERNQPNHPTHKILLSQQILIIEGLRLKDVPAKSYDMICLPLKINDVEALPARVILMD